MAGLGWAGHAYQCYHVPVSVCVWMCACLLMPCACLAVLLAHLETIRRLNYWGYAVLCLVVSFF